MRERFVERAQLGGCGERGYWAYPLAQRTGGEWWFSMQEKDIIDISTSSHLNK